MTYLAMYRGDDRTLTITASEDLAAVDAIRFTARRKPTDEAAIIEKSLGSGIALGDPTTTATVTIAAADTEELQPMVLHWDVEIEDGAGLIHTVATGRLGILEDITR